ncbi:hypothetical protein ABPG72_020034 [Tetrahymena utriculariae]
MKGIKIHKQINKTQLLEIIAGLKTDKQTGWTLSKMPDKQFLIDIVNHLDPENSLFSFVSGDKFSSVVKDFPVEQIRNLIARAFRGGSYSRLFKQINTTVFPHKGSALFKKTKEERERMKKANLQARIAQKEKRLALLRQEEEKNKKEMENLKSQLE